MSNLLIDSQPLVFQRELAEAVGLEKAIVLQTLHYLIKSEKSGRVKDGQRWIYNSYAQWQKQFFPFWSARTVERVFTELEKASLIESRQFDGRMSRKKSYRVLSGAVRHLSHERLKEAKADPAKLAPSEHAKLAPSITESHTENTNTNPYNPLKEGKTVRKELPLSGGNSALKSKGLARSAADGSTADAAQNAQIAPRPGENNDQYLNRLLRQNGFSP